MAPCNVGRFEILTPIPTLSVVALIGKNDFCLEGGRVKHKSSELSTTLVPQIKQNDQVPGEEHRGISNV